MFEGLLQPTHIVAALIVLIPIVLIGRILWRLGAKSR